MHKLSAQSTRLYEFLSTFPDLEDDDRRAFLCSDLQATEAQEEAYEFWTQLLQRATESGLLGTTRLSIHGTISELSSKMSFQGDTPMVLDKVLAQMQTLGKLQDLNLYLSGNMIAQRVIGWMVGGMFKWFVKSEDTFSSLVFVKLVERAADRLTEWHYANVTCGLMDNLMDLDEFRHRFAHVLGTSEDTEPLECLDLGDARVLVKRLTDCRVVATAPLVASGTSDNKSILIKFAHSASVAVKAPDETDRAAYLVRQTRENLETQVHKIEQRVNELDTKTRSLLTRGQRTAALSTLRLKKHMESKVLDQRIRALESMERVEWRLQQSNSDIQMVEALRVGALALRGMNERVEVTDVEKVLEEWVEEEAQAAQVEEALRDGWTVGRQEDMEDDEEELEAELAELIEDSKKSRAGVNVQDIDSKSVNNKSVDVLADALGQVDISPSRAEDKKNKEEEEEEESDDEQVAIPA